MRNTPPVFHNSVTIVKWLENVLRTTAEVRRMSYRTFGQSSYKTYMQSAYKRPSEVVFKLFANYPTDEVQPTLKS